MKKIVLVIQILFVIALGAGILYTVLMPDKKPVHDRDAWRSWEGFAAISYQGITKNQAAGYLTRSQLADHLSSLKKAGFNTITPEDAERYLTAGRPLPKKALLILFEGGRKDSYLNATPLLKKHQFFGVMCVPTRLTGEWGSFYLNERDLKDASARANWRLCSMGHRAIDMIPVGASGTKGHFLTSMKWGEGGVESPEAYEQRVKDDYRTAAGILQAAAGHPVAAYLYPYADKGTKGGPSSLPARVNQEGVQALHRIAFSGAASAFNSKRNGPFDLNRLRVPSSWDGTQLVKELERYFPREKAVNAIAEPGDWSVGGTVSFSPSLATLQPPTVMWLKGTDGWKDVEIKAALRIPGKSSAAVYARYSSPGSYVRLSVTTDGLQLQERIGKAFQTLATHRFPLVAGSECSLMLRVRGNRAWAHLGGSRVLGPVPLTPRTSGGSVGAGVQDGPAEFTEFTARKLPVLLVATETYQDLSPEIKERASTILTGWFKTGQPVSIDQGKRKALLLAAKEGISTFPVIDAREPLQKGTEDIFALRVSSALGASYLAPLVKTLAVKGDNDELCKALRAKGFRIARMISPSETGKILEGAPNSEGDLVIIEGDGREAIDALGRLLHRVPGGQLYAELTQESATDTGAGIFLSSHKGSSQGGSR